MKTYSEIRGVDEMQKRENIVDELSFDIDVDFVLDAKCRRRVDFKQSRLHFTIHQDVESEQFETAVYVRHLVRHRQKRQNNYFLNLGS